MTENYPTVYTISTCPACARLKKEWTEQGKPFVERQVDKSQAFLDEALTHGDAVPMVVYPDGKVEVGYPGMFG